MIGVAVFGAGRIGRVHAANVAAHPGARLRWVVDVQADAAKELARAYDAEAASHPDAALADPSVDAVVVASSTPTHVPLMIRAAEAQKAILCEKPIDLDLERVDSGLEVLRRTRVPVLVGFNRRFDPSFARLKQDVASGRIGKVEMVSITSRDPEPPSRDYALASGGLFKDMTIHDLDLARWLLGEEPVSVFAAGSALVSDDLRQLGDVDSAIVVLQTASGALAHISNSRRATYGYDQRVEVHGAEGMVSADNERVDTVSLHTADGIVKDALPRFFLERYALAYRRQMQHFLSAVEDPSQPLLVGAHDGRQALVLAEAAGRSLSTGRKVMLEEFA